MSTTTNPTAHLVGSGEAEPVAEVRLLGMSEDVHYFVEITSHASYCSVFNVARH